MTQPFRIQPNLPVQAYRTYELSRPAATHWRKASCEESGCAAYVNGWRTAVDEATDLGQQQATYIRARAGRSFRESRDDAGLTVFEFPAGQPCFRSDRHRVPLEREPVYAVRGGDWRATTGARRVLRADQWVDDFAANQDRLTNMIERG